MQSKPIEVDVLFGKPVKSVRGLLLSNASVTGKLKVQIEHNGEPTIIHVPSWRVTLVGNYKLPKGRR